MSQLKICAVIVLLCVGLTTSGGCSAARSRHAVPETLVAKAEVPGMSGIRSWGDRADEATVADLRESIRQETAFYAANPGLTMPSTADILAISGGGEDGAFGAGLLCGWTEAGTRPQFKLVTGISTGALIAPFAFLGPKYDPVLRESYTMVSKKDIFKMRGLLGLLSAESLTDNTPLRKMVNRIMTEQVMQEVAAEHRKGRRLLVATVNLDAQRPVIWNMGAIACSGDPQALELFRDVMIASASIPGAFPPVYFKVKADGKEYEEMHVDGGTYAQVFLYGPGLTRAVAKSRLGAEYLARPGRLFIIRNSMPNPAWAQVDAKLFSISGRAIATLIKANGLNDLIRLHVIATRDQLEFNLAHIPAGVGGPLPEPFDNQYMNNLFDYGYRKAKEGYPWMKAPPFVITF